MKQAHKCTCPDIVMSETEVADGLVHRLMPSESVMEWVGKDVSPVGWYVGSYVIRFIELEEAGNDDPEREFIVWENTVIVRAANLDEAYRKVVAVAESTTKPYRGGLEGVPVQWVFEGITELLPIFDELEDGAEIMWTEHEAVKLSDLRQRTVSLQDVKDHFGRKEPDADVPVAG